MKKINVVNGPRNVSAIVQGCMRMAPLSGEEAAKVTLSHHDWYQLYLAAGNTCRNGCYDIRRP